MGSNDPLDSSSAAYHDFLHLDPEVRSDVVFRLKSVRGHLEAILRQLDRPDTYCVDVLQQIRAVKGALSKVNAMVLRSHIKDHVTTAIVRGDVDYTVHELLDALKYKD